MAAPAKLTIRVTSTRSSTTIAYSTTGRYFRLVTSGFLRDLKGQPAFTSATADAFWLAVLGAVEADLNANPTPP